MAGSRTGDVAHQNAGRFAACKIIQGASCGIIYRSFHLTGGRSRKLLCQDYLCPFAYHQIEAPLTVTKPNVIII